MSPVRILAQTGTDLTDMCACLRVQPFSAVALAVALLVGVLHMNGKLPEEFS